MVLIINKTNGDTKEYSTIQQVKDYSPLKDFDKEIIKDAIFNNKCVGEYQVFRKHFDIIVVSNETTVEIFKTINEVINFFKYKEPLSDTEIEKLELNAFVNHNGWLISFTTI